MMAQPLADQIIQKIGEVHCLYHRLILIVGPAGSGKTSALQEVSARTSAPIINVNLELSRRMLDLTERQRVLKLLQLLQDICTSSVKRSGSDLVLLDNIEILFDPRLQQDPLRLLQYLSRNMTIVAAWPGKIIGLSEVYPAKTDTGITGYDSGRYLVYAVPEHPEYRRYPIRDLIIVDAPGSRRKL